MEFKSYLIDNALRTIVANAFDRKGLEFIGLRHESIPGSELVNAIADSIISQVQQAYTKSGKTLQVVAVDSDVRNALAVWCSKSYDWIVLSSGLLRRLYVTAQVLSEIIVQLVDSEHYFHSELAAKLASNKSDADPRLNGLSEALYVAGIAFFLGHEAGHHIKGHEARHLISKAVSESIWAKGTGTLDDHVLELDADRFGTSISSRFMVAYLNQIPKVDGLTLLQQQELELEIAHLVAAGVFLALSVFKPKDSASPFTPGTTHPASAFRAMWLSNTLYEELGVQLAHSNRTRQLEVIQEALLAVASIWVFDTLTDADRDLIERTGDKAALRISGIERIIFDDHAAEYVGQLGQRYSEVASELALYSRG